ncbi:MAG TPA: hypothetical protein VI542_26960, partial [Candidatus Tectomicrobia bacterium]
MEHICTKISAKFPGASFEICAHPAQRGAIIDAHVPTEDDFEIPGAWWWNTVGGWLVKQVLTDPYLDEIVAVLKSYDPDRIILFGSRAR